jgi:hypothetical protein
MVEIQQVHDDPEPLVDPTDRSENGEWQELMGKDLMLQVCVYDAILFFFCST